MLAVRCEGCGRRLGTCPFMPLRSECERRRGATVRIRARLPSMRFSASWRLAKRDPRRLTTLFFLGGGGSPLQPAAPCERTAFSKK